MTLDHTELNQTYYYGVDHTFYSDTARTKFSGKKRVGLYKTLNTAKKAIQGNRLRLIGQFLTEDFPMLQERYELFLAEDN